MSRALAALICVCCLFVVGVQRGAAQEQRELRWDRYDVAIDVRQDGSFRVCETEAITFTQGVFTTGNAVIPLDRVVSIQDVQVSEGPTLYRAGDGRQPNTYRVSRQDNNLRVDWGFPATSNRSRTFNLCYTVIGGLRIHEWGDQLWWKAVPGDRPFVVRSSTSTVRLPSATDPAQLIARAWPETVRAEVLDGQNARYEAGVVPANREVEIGLQFPHGLVTATPPPWQAALEAAEAEQARLQPYRDLANLLLGALSFIVLIGGGIGAYALWFARGRDVPVGAVAEYLREPPDDAPPAVVGTLIDEQAQLQDVLATLPDLGRRGVLRMTEVTGESDIAGLPGGRDYRFERLATDASLAPYEQSIMRAIFGNDDSARLSQLKGVFLARLPAVQQQLYEEVVKRGYFQANPDATRRRYRLLGAGLIGLALVLAVVVAPIFASFAGAVFLAPVALGVIGLVLLVLASAMARRTRSGALAAAKWQAFRRYLANIEHYDQLDSAGAIFERYLPYATAFGLERDWVRKFAAAGAPAPSWYGPTYPQDPTGYGRGYGRGGWVYGWPPGGQRGPGDGPVRDASGGGPTVQETSDQMLGSLQASSDGLLEMFDSASTVFASPPTPPPGSTLSSGGWSGGGGFGGGNWSGGGGFRGGGGGGGGSRGFG